MMHPSITPEPGKNYVIRHAGNYHDARFLRTREYEGSKYRRAFTHYIFLKLSTGREVEIKSRVKIIRQLGTEPYERGF